MADYMYTIQKVGIGVANKGQTEPPSKRADRPGRRGRQTPPRKACCIWPWCDAWPHVRLQRVLGLTCVLGGEGVRDARSRGYAVGVLPLNCLLPVLLSFGGHGRDA
jgi:hypothetical protein